jgi:hypothetical protein
MAVPNLAITCTIASGCMHGGSSRLLNALKSLIFPDEWWEWQSEQTKAGQSASGVDFWEFCTLSLVIVFECVCVCVCVCVFVFAL